jgi:hypothetical protein
MRSHEARRKAVGLDVTLNFFDGTMYVTRADRVAIDQNPKSKFGKNENQNFEKIEIEKNEILKNQNREK